MRSISVSWYLSSLIFICAVTVFLLFSFPGVSFAATGTSNNVLPAKWENIAVIAANTAKGDIPKLKAGLNAGLDAGLTVNEIKEVLIQMYAYCGFPRSLNGIQAFMEVVEERKSRGIEDEIGAEPSSLPAGKSREQIGQEVLVALVGKMAEAPPSGYQLFVPDIDRFLKEHLFADIFARGVLDYKTREIATISALSAIDSLEPQLAGHVMVGMNVGITEAQIRSLIPVIASRVGDKEANRMTEALNNNSTTGWK